jgi:mycoredoxin
MTDPISTQPITFYWRPGCGFCTMLERKLVKAGLTLDKRNIWDNPAYAAAVRDITGGNETVPTVIVADAAMVNPRAKHVLALVKTTTSES